MLFLCSGKQHRGATQTLAAYYQDFGAEASELQLCAPYSELLQ